METQLFIWGPLEVREAAMAIGRQNRFSLETVS